MKDENNASCESARPDPIRSAGFQLHVAVPAAGQFTTTPASFPAQNTPLSPEEWPVVSWHGESAATVDVTPVWTVTPTQGSPAAITVPVKVKVMKRRTVKVKVYLVDLLRDDGTPRELDADMIPTEESIRAHLNDIFAKQINAWFEVEIAKNLDDSIKRYLADPRTDGDFSFNLSKDHEAFTPDQLNVFSKTGCDPNVNIQIFMLATSGLIVTDVTSGAGAAAYGYTNRSGATCWVVGIAGHSNYKDVNYVYSTIAHEIGHVLTGYDHPDDMGVFPDRVAPLLGTERSVRLLCSQEKRSQQSGKLLVKAEWDAAETWLSEEERLGRMAP